MRALAQFLLTLWLLLFCLSLTWACAVDESLREYLSTYFWMPFSKSGYDLGRDREERFSAAFAGMEGSQVKGPLARLRAAYQGGASMPDSSLYDPKGLQKAVAAARSSAGLTFRDREEIELIDAKIDMRSDSLDKAAKKLADFLKKAHTPEFLSEARGWLAHIHYMRGEQSAAGKIYLDELNRSDSNLSRETLVSSLQMNYGYDGGAKLREHLEEYFDTAEHAAFAIQLATNPESEKFYPGAPAEPQRRPAPPPFSPITKLLERHNSLFQSEKGAMLLASLAIRIALSAGDPAAALRIAMNVPANDATRNDPDFQWMLASAHFLSHQYVAAQAPLLHLFSSSRSTKSQKAAAAYGLCGVYQKIGNTIGQLRFALWLSTEARKDNTLGYPSGIETQTVYWAPSGWDLGLLLDGEAPLQALRSFLQRYPTVPNVNLVKYSLAVRLARENQYEEAAQIYEGVNAPQRAARMRQMATLYHDANPGDPQAKFKLAQFLSANSEKVYFNDHLWSGFQRYALYADQDSRFTEVERRRQTVTERRLKDDQEELWRAHLILRDVVHDSGKSDLGRRAARLAIQCLRQISERFERQNEIRAADVELSVWLRTTVNR